jgi:predicted ATP-grasp superfamily ATP-dependent carboligase
MARPSLLLLGASTRAAAFSALRAELRPWCADLFADADLQARCPVVRVAGDRYPDGFLDLIGRGGEGPWLYTGALENRPALITALAKRRPLWGNDETALRRCRSPVWLSSVLENAGLSHPAVVLRAEDVPDTGRWLVKPLASAGGASIHFHGQAPSRKRPGKAVYYQEHIEGESCAAVYVAGADGARLLGVTRQLSGLDWLHSGPFRYAGSVGPLPLDAELRQSLERLGNVLTAGCHLRGLFGVDFMLRDGVPWPVEVNPRYTASVEVLEYALGLSALEWHRLVFEKRGRGPFPPAGPAALGRCREPSGTGSDPAGPSLCAEGEASGASGPARLAGPTQEPDDEKGPRPLFVGKAILSARAPLTFPADGPWQNVLCSPPPIQEMPAFADIPHAGEPIRTGQPILTFFASADTLADCLDQLRGIASDLDRRLFLR